MLSLTTMPLWLSAFLLVIVPMAIAMLGPVVVRRFVRLDRLRTNNEVAGFKFATVGVIYAVLLAFAVLVVWEKFNEAESNVAREAGGAATIFRLAAALEPSRGAPLKEAMTAYLEAVIAKDWPAMEHGRVDSDVTRTLSDLYTTLLTSRPGEQIDPILLAEILRQLDEISIGRRSRLIASQGTVPPILWYVLFGGAVITVAFTFFFGAENLRAQRMMTGALSILIFSGLLTVVVIDRPFAGGVKVHPEALAYVLRDIAGVTRE
ncbi:MAG TPA: hypothetical protein VGJ01_22675 [Pseudolabrys sp.]